MLGAISRVFTPGCKFEYMLCFAGGQGAGKSTFLRFLAMNDDRFTDDIKNLDDDKVFQRLQGHWITEFKKDTEQGHRSILTHDRFKSDWNRFYKDTVLSGMDIADIKVSHIKSHYKSISANESLTRNTLTNAKTLLNHIFDYAVDKDYIPYNIARSVNTRDLHCKESDNELKVYSDEERAKILKQADIEGDVFARAIAHVPV